MNEWIKKTLCIHTHNEILSSHIKGNQAIHDNTDGPGGHYAQ